MSCAVCRRPKFSMGDPRVRYADTPCDGSPLAQYRDDLRDALSAENRAMQSLQYCRDNSARLKRLIADLENKAA